MPTSSLPTQELLDKCNPLGVFDAIATLAVAQNMRDLYRLVLVDTPLAPYFSGGLGVWLPACSMGSLAPFIGISLILWCSIDAVSQDRPSSLSQTSTPFLPLAATEHLTSEDLDEMNIEVLRNTLYKAYLDDFAGLCGRLGGATHQVMGDLLAFEADRRALNITLNSIGTELTRDDRRRLYANFGLLYPNGGTLGPGGWGAGRAEGCQRLQRLHVVEIAPIRRGPGPLLSSERSDMCTTSAAAQHRRCCSPHTSRLPRERSERAGAGRGF